MKISNRRVKAFAGLVMNGGIHCLIAAATGGTTSILGELTKSITGNLASDSIASLSDYSYDKLATRLEKPDPSSVNHDLERLFRESSVVALEFIKTLFLSEVVDDGKPEYAFTKEERKEFMKGLTIFFDENINDLRNVMKAEATGPLDKRIIKKPKEFLDNIIDQIFRVSSVTFDAGTEEYLKNFYARNLPYCFELAFKEALKNDDLGFKAFQIWVMEELREQNTHILGDQQKILNSIRAIENGIDSISGQQVDTILEKQQEKIYGLLEKDLQNISTVLKDLSEAIQANFERHYSLLVTVDKTTTDTLAVVTKTSEDVQDIKEELTRIKGNTVIPHHLIKPLPPVPEVFLGREQELEEIRKKLVEDNNFLLLVNGNGGIGKTTLASIYYHTYGSYYKHAAWILSEKSIANALLLLAAALQVEFEDTMPADKRLLKLIEAMTELDKPCLLVIDNANEIKDLEECYLLLRSCSNFHLLLTTRITDFHHAKSYAISGLPENIGLELFKKYYTRHHASEDELFKQIRKAVGENTLVIELLAKNLNEINQDEVLYTLFDLLKDLQRKGLLGLESYDVDTGYQARGTMRHEKPESIIGAMYELGELSKAEINLLSVFAVLPAENISYTTLKGLLQPQDARAFSETLKILHRKGWLEKSELNNAVHYKVSPVIQEIIKEKNPLLYQDCSTLVNGLIKKLEYQGTGHFLNTTYEEANLYAKYSETVVNNFEEVHYNFCGLLERLGAYYFTTGNLNKSLDFFLQYNYLVKQFFGNNPTEEDYKEDLAISNFKLGNTHLSLGNLKDAEVFYEESSRLFNELYNKHPENEYFKKNFDSTFGRLGDLQVSLGNLEKALSYYEQSNQLSKELVEAHPDNLIFKMHLSFSYEKLGNIQRLLGNLNNALLFYKDEKDLLEQLSNSDPENVELKHSLAVSYQYVGYCLLHLEDQNKGLFFLEKYNSLEKELFEAYPQNVEFKRGLAISYSRLGEAYGLLVNNNKALENHENECRLFLELFQAYPQNVSFKNGLAISYQNIGNIESSSGNDNKAFAYFEKFNHLYKELHEAYPQNVNFKNGLAISFSRLGRHFKNKDELDNALFYLQSAQKHMKELTTAFPDHAEFRENLDRVTTVLNDLQPKP